ncbi:MAG: hypothetical protein M1389_14420 [Chloroflexi bacterium]|nr:hypothetical protein [Chloroflexota bacterium]
MEYFAALGLALAIWAPPLVGFPSLAATLGSPLAYLLGDTLARAIAATAVASASALAVAMVLMVYEQLAFPAGVPQGSRSAQDLLNLPLTREGNARPAIVAIIAPLLFVLQQLFLESAGPFAGELTVLAAILALAGLQCLRPTGYRNELLPGFLSIGRRLGQIGHRGQPMPQRVGELQRRPPSAPPSSPEGFTITGHLEG